VGSLLIGCAVAKSLAWVHKKPLVGVNHLEGHIYASFLTEDPPEHPFLALVVSGGHTALYHAKRPREYGLVGQTRDDAAGEAFDKVAKLLGLGFPGGPIIKKRPSAAIPARSRFRSPTSPTAPTTFVQRHQDVGLALREGSPATLGGSGGRRGGVVPGGVVKMLVRRTLRAPSTWGRSAWVLTGGVAANRPLRAALAAEPRSTGVRLHIPPPRLCTDNAAMIAAAGTSGCGPGSARRSA